MSTKHVPGSHCSDEALSVYRILSPKQLAEPWSGEPYAVRVTRPNGGLAWYVATEDEASAHGRWFGWDRVAAVVSDRRDHSGAGICRPIPASW